MMALSFNDAHYYANPVDGPARRLFAIVPDDGNLLALVPRALYVGTGGALVVQACDDTAPVTLVNVPNGALLDIRAQKVMATGTTASNIVGLA
jgi:hypothetical protein